ncbi:oxidoreductase [Lepidopterella palustris CBS 459.81]|uniref:Oxidoreductase n=1 Tax=Lepidopterella palustris CBS 459.81 TaxID=1314670 RepID=A0A8E2ECW8_9PEZI|nr:oxidoreductase [Lepidopterella palustris CBS 459.81]
MSSQTEFPGVAAITGAGSGMGAAVARAFAAAGCPAIALIDINQKGLEATNASIASSSPSAKVSIHNCNVADASSVSATFAAILSEHGRLDYAVNCAGVPTNHKPSTECSIEDFDRINGVNYRGLWLCSRAELGIMKAQPPPSPSLFPANLSTRTQQRGAIVNISSGAALASPPSSSAYCGSKAAIMGLTRSDAVDYARYGIRVNCVLPGVIDTPMTYDTPENRRMLETAIVPLVPLGRLGVAEEIADVAVFLCGRRASYVQGANWMVDGGFTCQ